MRIVIDWDLCRGHGHCTGEAPDVFAVDDDGKLTVLQEFPSPELREKIEIAARYCPTGAITLESEK